MAKFVVTFHEIEVYEIIVEAENAQAAEAAAWAELENGMPSPARTLDAEVADIAPLNEGEL